MHGLQRIALLSIVVSGLGCAPDLPTVVPLRHETHPGPGSSGPDQHSKNVKLLANVPRSGTATQSDLAFAGRYAFAGNYEGFRIVDIADPQRPLVVSTVACHGAQGDVSVYVASVPTDCGSHTHTLVPDPANGRVLLYVSSYPVGLFSTGPGCHEPHGYISIVHVPLGDPAAATVTRYWLDGATQLTSLAGSSPFSACHDVAVFVELRRAAASCLSESQLWDISDPAAPQFLWRFDDDLAVRRQFNDIWHSASFSWDGRTVAFGDESGGGSAERCTDPADVHGRVWFLDVASGSLLGSYKLPRSVATDCTVHYFNFLPLPKGRRVLVSAWYTGGTSIVDVDKLLAGASAADAEVGFYRPSGANTWASYWYNGFVYTNDIFRGVDVMLLSDNSRSAASKVLPHLNPQTQEALIR